MATRRGGLVPRKGAWNGVFVGTDLVPRNVTLALDRRGTRLSGQLTIVVYPDTGVRASVRVTGTHVSGKITLTATLPRIAKAKNAEMKITGRLVNLAGDRQSIVATTLAAARSDEDIIGGVSLNGALCLITTRAAALAEADGGGWVEENPEQG